MRWLKGLLFDNLGTKLMALVLALLLWIYLYNESTDSDEFDAVFQPKVEAKDLASWRVYASDGRPIEEKITIKLTGPKGEIKGFTRKRLLCEPRFEPSLFAEKEGAFPKDLTIDDLNLPETFRVVFRPSQRITIKYVKYHTIKVRVVLPPVPTEGKPKEDYMVQKVEITEPPGPDHLAEVRLPYNRKLTEIRVKPVSVQNKFDDFPVPNATVDLVETDVRLVRDVSLKVTIVLETKDVKIQVPVSIAGASPAILGRLEIPPKTVSVKVTGPKSEIAKIDLRNPGALFYAVALVEMTSVNPGERGDLKQIYCAIRDPDALKKVTIELDPKDQTVPYTVK